MDGYIQTAIGVFVSVVFFLIGYRQTIGARKERAVAANRAVYKALLRRLVLESYSPKIDELNRLIEGKAHEYRVPPSDLHPDEQVLNQVFAEIFDNDFIAPDKRTEIGARVGTAFDELARGRQRVDETSVPSGDLARRRSLLVAALGLLASLMGALFALFLMLGKGLPLSDGSSVVKSLVPVFSVFIASLATVASLSFVKRARESPDELPTRTAFALEAAALESELANILRKLGLHFQIQPKIGLLRPDFLAEVNGKRVAIEAKAWRSHPPLAVASRAARYLNEIIASGRADAAVIVTRGRFPALQRLVDSERVAFVAAKDLPDWLRSIGGGS